VKVIAYDRLIPSASIAVYVSFDFFEIGRLQAREIVAAMKNSPMGRIVLMAGSPTDISAHRLRAGQMEILQPLIVKGDLRIVEDQWVTNWDPKIARQVMRSVVQKTKGRFDAVVASNDGTAYAALEALRDAGLAGKVPISGMDATAAGCNSIARGELTMTVLKDDRLISPTVSDIAIKLARHEGVPGLVPYKLSEYMFDRSLAGELQCVFLPSMPIARDNMKIMVVDTGYQDYDDVYAGVADPPPR
jgi:D-xylose transport system substrate-binding protein